MLTGASDIDLSTTVLGQKIDFPLFLSATAMHRLYNYEGEKATAKAEYEIGFLNVTPSFAPGYYNYGNGKDLGYPLEFKSEIQMSLNLNDSSKFGMSYNHISNGSLSDKNPGANSYMINFLKQF